MLYFLIYFFIIINYFNYYRCSIAENPSIGFQITPTTPETLTTESPLLNVSNPKINPTNSNHGDNFSKLVQLNYYFISIVFCFMYGDFLYQQRLQGNLLIQMFNLLIFISSSIICAICYIWIKKNFSSWKGILLLFIIFIFINECTKKQIKPLKYKINITFFLIIIIYEQYQKKIKNQNLFKKSTNKFFHNFMIITTIINTMYFLYGLFITTKKTQKLIINIHGYMVNENPYMYFRQIINIEELRHNNIPREFINKHLVISKLYEEQKQYNDLKLELSEETKKGLVCSICLCEFNDDQLVNQFHGSHIFHTKCIENWVIKSNESIAQCPLCKNHLYPNLNYKENN